MKYTYTERYKLLRKIYPHHLKLSCLINAHSMRNEVDWDHLNYDVQNENIK